jgi:D-alanyl-D-alanine carboxypeptidase/D-alanyl-D-alanine-endopeptidase (penicillin-binding protein 4)
VVAPVSALSVDGGRVTPERDERVADPAMTAAVRFATALSAAGVAVTGTPVPGVSPEGADVVSSVQSPTVAQMVETMLVDSDNDVAEALLRLVGASRGTLPADVASSAAAAIDANARAGVDVTGVSLRDGSGLARSNSVPARALGSVLDIAADDPTLAPVIARLPIAGFTGTLDDRFDNAADRAGAGVVRAKTGTLNGVSSLSGTVVSTDGRLLAFAFMADQVPLASTLDARAAFDAAATALAQCGCH